MTITTLLLLSGFLFVLTTLLLAGYLLYTLLALLVIQARMVSQLASLERLLMERDEHAWTHHGPDQPER